MTLATVGVPDLLRRFSLTPYSSVVSLGATSFQVETNDLAIIAELRKAAVEQTHNGCGLWLLKLVRDNDAPADRGDVTVLSAYPLIVLRVGLGTNIVLDCEKHEALGFLSAGVTAKEFAYALFPIVCKLLISSSRPTPRIDACQ